MTGLSNDWKILHKPIEYVQSYSLCCCFLIRKRSTRSSVSEEGMLQESVSLTNIQMSVTGSVSTNRGLYDVVEELEPGVIPQLVDEDRESSVNELMR